MTQIPRLASRLVAFWTLLAIFDFSMYLVWLGGRFPGDVRSLLWYVAARVVLWIAVSWVLFFFMDRLARLSRSGSIAGIGVVMLAVTSAVVVVNSLLMVYVGPWRRTPPQQMIASQFRLDFHGFLLWISMIVALGRGIQILYAEEQETLRHTYLETALSRARTHVLADQLAPHFLFNTLTGVSSCIARDLPAALRMTDGLRRLLTYAGATSMTVLLREELEFVRCYLELQSMRFPDRLIVHIAEIPEDVLDCEVPRLVLQPLVENAVKYGMGAGSAVTVVDVSALRSGAHLLLRVKNTDGPLANLPGLGVGLAGVRARLELLFGREQSIEIRRNENAKSTTVEVRIPVTRRTGASAG